MSPDGRASGGSSTMSNHRRELPKKPLAVGGSKPQSRSRHFDAAEMETPDSSRSIFIVIREHR